MEYYPVPLLQVEANFLCIMTTIRKQIKALKGSNSKLLKHEQYKRTIEEVKDANARKKKKTSMDYRRLDKYAVVEADSVERLSEPMTAGETVMKFYVHADELYDVCREVHLQTGHGGRNMMEAYTITEKYANISQKVHQTSKNHCGQCLSTEPTQRRGVSVRPIVQKEMNARVQIDLIDMQTSPDGEFRFILVVQDHLTKFIHLTALPHKESLCVAQHVVEIFLVFGAPSVLQSDNGREFADRIINSLQEMWQDLKIVHGTPRHSQIQGSVERANRDILDILIKWMRDNGTTHWVEGLEFVASMKNRRHHQGIGRSPYEALVGCPMKVGLGTAFPPELVSNLESEEDLEVCVERMGREQPLADPPPPSPPESTSTSPSMTPPSRLDFQGFTLASPPHPGEAPKCLACGETCVEQCSACLQPLHSDCGKDGRCSLCARSQTIAEERSGSVSNLKKQAAKMLQESRERYPPAAVGDTVIVPIPDVDRGRGDPRNVTCVVAERSEAIPCMGPGV
ncbi:KRAB-A domain-containing protein 2 [Frankliniella fusca]|uniref:KRAB-A domain-containing protein 2 n=1 Tax=Frankliniella fusca TaxID=407009 RepID=A0AAE1HMT0_9NEOP|nr:KRAB-A domain-containing protein 2 [Frankliniella fusca]